MRNVRKYEHYDYANLLFDMGTLQSLQKHCIVDE